MFLLYWVWIFFWDLLNKKEFDFMGLFFNEIGIYFWYGLLGVGKFIVIYYKNLECGYYIGKVVYIIV